MLTHAKKNNVETVKHWPSNSAMHIADHGQARRACQRGAPFRAQTQKTQYVHNNYFMRQKFTNEPTCDIHTVSSRAASLHDPRFAHLPHEDLIPTYAVDGPRDEYQKDAATANPGAL